MAGEYMVKMTVTNVSPMAIAHGWDLQKAVT